MWLGRGDCRPQTTNSIESDQQSQAAGFALGLRVRREGGKHRCSQLGEAVAMRQLRNAC
jgi:hypothetical protein